MIIRQLHSLSIFGFLIYNSNLIFNDSPYQTMMTPYRHGRVSCVYVFSMKYSLLLSREIILISLKKSNN